MMEDQYVKAIIPGLITYFKWLDDTLELETILEMEGLGIEDEDIFQTSKENTRKDITISILWALSFLPERKICKLCMLDEDLMLLVLKCFRESKNPYLRLPALRFLGNVCSDDDILAKKLMVDYNFAEALKTSIKDKKTFLRKETCWVASNIVCGPMSNIFLVMKNLLEDICHMYLYDTPQIMEEAS